MMRDVHDDDLALLRTFRLDEAAPPDGLFERLAEDLQREIDHAQQPVAAGGGARARHRAWRPWSSRLVRPALVAMSAVALAGGVGIIGSFGTLQTPRGAAGIGSTQVQSTHAATSLLEGAASSLFGGRVAPEARPGIALTRLDGTGDTQRARAAFVALARDGELEADEIAHAPADPVQLRDMLRSAVGELDTPVADQGDRVAFLLALRIVADADVPVEVRANTLRALGGIDGIDRALRVRDSLGRSGMLLGHYDTVTGIRDEFVLGLGDAHINERRSFTTAYMDPGCPPGTVTSYALYDDAGDVVTPHQAPMLDWPQVVGSCDHIVE